VIRRKNIQLLLSSFIEIARTNREISW